MAKVGEPTTGPITLTTAGADDAAPAKPVDHAAALRDARRPVTREDIDNAVRQLGLTADFDRLRRG